MFGKGVGVRLAATCALGLALHAGAAQEAVAFAGERFDTVVIDAGHGGDDHGAERNRVVEKELVLDVAQRLGKRLSKRGVRVVFTRSSDVFVPLEERTSIANDARADLFVSIHANSAPSRSARGIETYFVSLEASDEASRRVAERENQAFGAASIAAVQQDPLLAVLGDMIQTEVITQSDQFAKLAEEELNGVAGVGSRGVKQAPFVVLMGVQMPASLIEIGFLTNPQEARALGRSARRDEIASALERAILRFGKQFDQLHGVRGRAGAPSSAPASAGRSAQGPADGRRRSP